MNIRFPKLISRSVSIFQSSINIQKNLINKTKFLFSLSPQDQQGEINKLKLYYRLCRYDKPIGAMLLFWPTAWGVCIGSTTLPSLFYLSLFYMGSITSRSAGCIVNDYFDKDFDKNVQRTKQRPLATGQVSNKEALTLLISNLCGGLIVLSYLPLKVQLITMGFVALAGVYPLAKRIINYPQIVLGIAFNSGIIIGSLTINPQVNLAIMIPIYLSGISWTLVYDTIYAYQDIDDDIRLGIKSTAVTWKDKNPKKIIQNCISLSALCHLGVVMVDVSYCYSGLLMLGADYYLYDKLKKLDINNKQQCGQFFKSNNYYGFFIFCSLLATNIINWFNSIVFKQ